MKKNKKLMTGALLLVTVTLLATTIYISALLSSPDKSPTQIQKTKASAVTYKKEIDLADNFGPDKITPIIPLPSMALPTLAAQVPVVKPTLLAQVPTLFLTPIIVPTNVPTKVPTKAPTAIPEPTSPPVTPTLQPLLAYKSTSISPTLIPVKDTGGMVSPSPTKKVQPTGVQNLPETGWIQMSSILFIVATTTILFSLLF